MMMRVTQIDGNPALINLDWVECILRDGMGNASVHMAFQETDGIEPDHLTTAESFETICARVAQMQGGVAHGKD